MLYHSTNPAPNDPLVGDDTDNVTPEMLYEQLSVLRKYFSIVSVDEIADRASRGLSLKHLAAVTFDDGYRSVLDHALPILESLRLPATLFLIGNVLGSSWFWRDQVRYVIESGRIEEFLEFAGETNRLFKLIRPEDFYRDTKDPAIIGSRIVHSVLEEYFLTIGDGSPQAPVSLYCDADDIADSRSEYLMFGSHSNSHYVMSTLSRAEQEEDIETSQRSLQALGVPMSDVFALPFGGERDANGDTRALLAEHGYTAMCLTQTGMTSAYSRTSSPDGASLVTLRRFMPLSDRWFLL